MYDDGLPPFSEYKYKDPIRDVRLGFWGRVQLLVPVSLVLSCFALAELVEVWFQVVDKF